MKAAYTKVTFLIIAKYVLQRLETLATIYDYFWLPLLSVSIKEEGFTF